MKKYLMAAVALICMTITCVAFSACNSEEDESSSIVYYRANGSMSSTGSDAILAAFAVADYTTAITNAIGGDYIKGSKDSEVIAACDKVFEKHRANHPSWSGYVTITKYQGMDDENGTVIKSYQYN
jgi:hypothetical protein